MLTIRPFPVVLLMCMAAGSAMSAFLFENHVKLVDGGWQMDSLAALEADSSSCRHIVPAVQYLQSSLVKRYPYALAKPICLVDRRQRHRAASRLSARRPVSGLVTLLCSVT